MKRVAPREIEIITNLMDHNEIHNKIHIFSTGEEIVVVLYFRGEAGKWGSHCLPWERVTPTAP